MNKLTKLLFASLLFSISSVVFAHYGEFAQIEDPAITAQKNKSYIERDIREIHAFMDRDNALTQKFVNDKNSKPFIDEREEFEKIEELNNKLWADQMEAVTEETVAEMIKAEENFIKNLDIKWDLAKERKYLNLEKVTSAFDQKRAGNEKKLNRLKQKLAKL